MILDEESSPSFDEIIEHYGIPGMKWGKRKARPTTAPAPKKAKKPKPTSEEIYKARRELNYLQTKTLTTRDEYLNAGINGTEKQKNKAFKEYEKAVINLGTSDARVNAQRLTRGEAVVFTLLTGPAVLIPVASLAVTRKVEAKSVAKAKAKYNVK